MTRAVALGCSAAASPLLTPVSFAAAPWDSRLVVIILRGGMDGLEVVQPRGAAEYAALRKPDPALGVGAEGGPIDLDGYFAMHPALGALAPLWAGGQLAFVHAVSTPYRNKRSHFDGQDILEAGTPGLDGGMRDGWLNRLLQAVPGVEAETAFAVGRSDMLLMRGAAPVANWSPDAGLQMVSPQAMRLLQRVMHDDPLFSAALSEAVELSSEDLAAAAMEQGGMAMGADMQAQDGEMSMAQMVSEMRTRAQSGGHRAIAEYAGRKLLGDTRIAAFSLNGWDTHAYQSRTLVPPLTRLAEMIVALRETVGAAVWQKTVVVTMTEFGRTARLNGSQGTDHGTGGAMILAGGALKGGRVAGDWPGLAEADLYQRRDLMPTADVRAHAAWIMRGLFGLERGVLENTVFPGLEMGRGPGHLI
ncbi:DUF1501 domain-containing protein [Marimonas lutisalis]|uniref:DUF1501 domain-containing protein n=1 Tax=Marimonas lutisalis TaxID=2545756 RepID=UPI001F21E46E|nr:DUF1501 domain-containing protein [Marimonas lutisalis]